MGYSKLNIVLFEPEIHTNVGAIMRTASALNAKLHLIEPFGFFFDERFEKSLNRSSANNVKNVNYTLYDDWNDFIQKHPNKNFYFSTRYAQKIYTDFNFQENKEEFFLIFGKESTGIPIPILKQHLENCMRIPMQDNVRSLNLSNSVSIISYEILRQLNFENLAKKEVQKGPNFLLK
ncbi:tRNA (cytidine(34)-2'-O)-methyltransferase [Spiroplasma endosymbiont of Amphibalanus improvisus]|uniref:tRNA (cytidine(34)-2'-O)-methyltransferase n=1 Tax=Spiroplasma endosymbiont of Amphibalanus improvisus TaxID=3066327 RepID=UPI00313B1902